MIPNAKVLRNPARNAAEYMAIINLLVAAGYKVFNDYSPEEFTKKYFPKYPHVGIAVSEAISCWSNGPQGSQEKLDLNSLPYKEKQLLLGAHVAKGFGTNGFWLDGSFVTREQWQAFQKEMAANGF